MNRPTSLERERSLVPSGPFEEHPDVARALAALEARAHSGGASSALFLPQRGVRFEAYAFAWGTGFAKEMNILAKPAGPLRGTLIINISGHATGGVVDRLLASVVEEIRARGVDVIGDSALFLAVRDGCDAVHRAFASDPQRTHAALALAAPGVALSITRERYDDAAAVIMGSAGYWRGNEALRQTFAATNTYNVRVRFPDGTMRELRDVARNRPGTLEFATRIPLELPDLPGTTVLQAWPSGSAAVSSYREAREYAIHVERELFDVAHQVALAEKFQALHDEVRWDTPHEDDDRARHAVPPAPFPYEDF